MFPNWLTTAFSRFFGYHGLSPEVIENRTFALVMVGIIAALDFVYNLAFYCFGYPFAWWTTLGYSGASLLNLIAFKRRGNYRLFRNLQLALTIALPLAAQLTHGGFTGSSGVVLAAFLAPLGAMTLSSFRTARRFFFGYLAALFLAGLIEYFLHPAFHTLPPGYSLLFFEFNFAFTAAVAYFLMEGFLRNKARLQQALEQEHSMVDALLRDILPAETAEELKRNGSVSSKRYQSVTVLFTDFIGFSKFARYLTAEALVEQLDFYFRAFDEITCRHGLEKIKTIGDSYMCAGGLPIPSEDHAIRTVRAALEIRQFVMAQRNSHLETFNYPFDIRIGLHTGPVVAGVVGSSKISYDIWGETVNIAARMEQACEPDCINISQATYDLVGHHFACTFRGIFPAKHIGEVEMYYVE